MYDWIRRQFFSDNINFLTQTRKKKFNIQNTISVEQSPDAPQQYKLAPLFKLQINSEILQKYPLEALKTIMASQNPPAYFWLIALKMKELDDAHPLQEHARKLAGVWKEFHQACERAFFDADLFYDTPLYHTMLIKRANGELSSESMTSYLIHMQHLLSKNANLFEQDFLDFEETVEPIEINDLKKDATHPLGKLSAKKSMHWALAISQTGPEFEIANNILPHMPNKFHPFIASALQAKATQQPVIKHFFENPALISNGQFNLIKNKADYIEACILLELKQAPDNAALFTESYRAAFDSLLEHFTRMAVKKTLTPAELADSISMLNTRIEWNLEQREQQNRLRLTFQWLGISWMRQDFEQWRKDIPILCKSNPGYMLWWSSFYIGLTLTFIFFPIMDEMIYPLLNYVHDHDFNIEDYHVDGNGFKNMLEDMDKDVPYSSLIVIKPITMIVERVIRAAANTTLNATHQVIQDIKIEDLKNVLSNAKNAKAELKACDADAAPQSIAIPAKDISKLRDSQAIDEFTIGEKDVIPKLNEEACKAAEKKRIEANKAKVKGVAKAAEVAAAFSKTKKKPTQNSSPTTQPQLPIPTNGAFSAPADRSDSSDQGTSRSPHTAAQRPGDYSGISSGGVVKPAAATPRPAPPAQSGWRKILRRKKE